MLIIWKGFGLLVPVIWLTVVVLTETLLGPQTYEHHGWPKFLASFLAAIVIGLVGVGLNRNRRAGDKHSFFFVDMEAWAFISVVLGIVFALRS